MINRLSHSIPVKDINIIPEIRALIFDVDGTLYQKNKLRRLIFKQMLIDSFYNPIKGVEAIISILSYRLAMERLRTIKLVDRTVKEMQFEIASRICLINKIKIEEHVYRWMRCEPTKYFKYVKYPYLDNFLKEAKNKGLKLAVFSDYPVDNKIDALGYNNIFDLVISSQDLFINKLKPDPAGIEYIIKHFGLRKKEIIYIGDRHDIDTKTAYNAGVKCIIIEDKRGSGSDEIMRIESYKQLYWFLNENSGD